MMFVRDGGGAWHLFPLDAADKPEQHLLMRIVAMFVESKGCDAIVEVGEMWSTLVAPEEGGAANRMRQILRREELFVMVATREGYFQAYVTPFRRGPLGGIKLEQTHSTREMQPFYLQPILSVWHKQGYVPVGDGKVRRQIWEPDPLDECFCGGPERFAECCRPHLPCIPASMDSAVHDALSGKNFKTAEALARACVAQYVIWVKQHTVGPMNVAPELHKMIVDIDVPALQGHIHTLETALQASGNAELFVPLVRRLAERIGVPRLSVTLTALVARSLFRSGQPEEAILELDRLGDIERVDDTLALITAARFHADDPKRTEQLLLKAIGAAVSDEERWAAQIELIEHMLDFDRTGEAKQLLETLITESQKSKHWPEGFPPELFSAGKSQNHRAILISL
jgi:hypothetical protein